MNINNKRFHLIAITLAVGIIGGVVVNSNNRKAVAEAERMAKINALTAEDIVKNIPDALPAVENVTITANYGTTPLAIEATGISDGNKKKIVGRTAVDPKNGAFNNDLAQYIENIGNITTFYTLNPDSEDSNNKWVKETLTDTDETPGYRKMSSMPAMLTNLAIDEKTKADNYSSYALTGHLPEEYFPTFFYNYFGTEKAECDVTLLVDKATNYLIGVELDTNTNATGNINRLHAVVTYTANNDNSNTTIDIPSDSRAGIMEEGCALFYINKEVKAITQKKK